MILTIDNPYMLYYKKLKCHVAGVLVAEVRLLDATLLKNQY